MDKETHEKPLVEILKKDKDKIKSKDNKPKRITYVQGLKDENKMEEESPKKEIINKKDSREPMKKDATLTKEQIKLEKTRKQQQEPTPSKANIKRPDADSSLTALVEGLDTASDVIHCDSYYALMIKLETDRFYRINGDMYVKINTRGLLRPYDVIYLQPWEERDRMSFQELQYSRRIMHYSDRVAIEVGSKTAIVKLLVGCTTSSATAAVLHTQQATSFLPAFVDKWGWGYNVPSGAQRASFYSQDHILLRIRKRSSSRDNLSGKM